MTENDNIIIRTQAVRRHDGAVIFLGYIKHFVLETDDWYIVWIMTTENKIIRAGWLVDGSGSEAVKDCLIKLSRESVSSVIEITKDSELPPEYLDYSDFTIIPGGSSLS